MIETFEASSNHKHTEMYKKNYIISSKKVKNVSYNVQNLLNAGV